MERGRRKIVLDTTWYVSGTINRKSRRTLYSVLADKRNVIYYSSELLSEYKEVIQRKKFRKYVSLEQASKFLKLILPRLIFASAKSKVILSRDRKDDYLLSLSNDVKANFLITSDDDLLVIKKIGITKIVTMSEFKLMSLKKF